MSSKRMICAGLLNLVAGVALAQPLGAPGLANLEALATEPFTIELADGSTLGLASESVEVSASWENGRLRAQLPVVAGAEQWDLILSTTGGVDRMRVAAPRIRVQVDGSAREADVVGAEALIPHVPYVLEARALPSSFEGEPPNFTKVLAIGRFQPIYAP